MSFLSWQYPFFLLAAVLIYWRLPHRGRTFLLLAASYVFYGAWDARFLALILTTTVMDYFAALAIGGHRSAWWKVAAVAALPLAWLASCRLLGRVMPPAAFGAAALFIPFLGISHALIQRRVGEAHRPKAFLLLSVGTNLVILGFFKYFNFFSDSAVTFLSALGLQPHEFTLRILLPIGISFYTFQSISYVADVYRGLRAPRRSFPTFAAYLAFFPQLLAGPIGRSPQLMPQWETPRAFSPATIHEGARLILVGLFKKIFVADNCALLANFCFLPGSKLNAAWSVLGVLAFAFQIYGDFSGYTDIARGSAKLFGFDLMVNFRFPYTALTPSDFWRRWHISLSSWFRDYVYIPLGGNRVGRGRLLFNLMATMLLAGLWHGAGWMYVLWGAYLGALLIVYRLIPPLAALDKATSWWKRCVAAWAMFFFTLIGWAIFRAPDAQGLVAWANGFTHWTMGDVDWVKPALWLALHVAPLLLLQALTWKQQDESDLTRFPWAVRGVIYFALLLLVVSSSSQDQEFLYFQF
ncbi:MAG: MBOAT family O-acyltransferase [bacterium]